MLKRCYYFIIFNIRIILKYTINIKDKDIIKRWNNQSINDEMMSSKFHHLIK